MTLQTFIQCIPLYLIIFMFSQSNRIILICNIMQDIIMHFIKYSKRKKDITFEQQTPMPHKNVTQNKMRIDSSNILRMVHLSNANFVQFSHHWGPLGRPARCHKGFKGQFQSQKFKKNDTKEFSKPYHYHSGLIHSKEMRHCNLWFQSRRPSQTTKVCLNFTQ